ncbi:MAG: efflux RND transporter periplasmic adaptor subunit, partial [bacterium]|nr:efflux RND transporter periplasmic adaptor subunit [bacterium]
MSPSDANVRPRRKSRVVLLITLAVLMLLAVIAILISRSRKDDTVLVSATRQDIVQNVSATGSVTLQTGAMVNVGAEVSGKLKKLYVDVGSTVRPGQLLAEMDVPEQASLLLQAGASVDAAAGRLAETQALAEQARRDAARTEMLYRQGAVSRVDAETASTRYRTALTQVDAAAAALRQAEAEYQRQNTNVAKSRIYSPIGGTVLTIDAEGGETITAGFTTPTILTVANLKRLQID